MLGMHLPVLRVLCGQRFVADDQHILGILLLRGFGELNDPVMTVSPSMTITVLCAMAWLASIVFLPLPTEVLGTLHGSRGASAFYILSVWAVSVALIGLNLAMAAAPQLHKEGAEPIERTGGIAVSVMILVALAIALAFPSVGLYAMFVLVLADPLDRHVIRRFDRTARATTVATETATE